MSNLRVVLVALCGFTMPVLLGIFAAPYVFENSIPSVVSPSSEVEISKAIHPDFHEQGPSELPLPVGPASVTYQSYLSDSALDPTANWPFVVSVAFRLDGLPEEGVRKKLIYKYDADSAPYQGWALALYQRSTSFRPELYWQDSEGKGGWFSFDELDIELGKWYSVTVLAQPGKSVSMFLEQLVGSPSGDDQLKRNEASISDNSQRQAKNKIQKREVKFVGGFEVESEQSPSTKSELFVVASSTAGEGLRADVSQVVITSLKKVPQELEQVLHLLKGGPESLARRLDIDQIGLWIDETKTDRSKFARISTGFRSS